MRVVAGASEGDLARDGLFKDGLSGILAAAAP